MYGYYSKVKLEEGSDEIEKDVDVDDEDAGYISDEENDKFNYVMTHENNYNRGSRLPECIVLRDPYPGEAKIMIKRKSPAVLRFNKPKPGNNPQR